MVDTRPDSVVFNCTLAGETGTIPVRIENRAGRTLVGVQVLIPRNPFLITGVPTGPFNIPDGGRENLLVRFLPDRVGTWVDSIVIIAGGEIAVVRLKGTSPMAPRVQAIPGQPALQFGSIALGDTVQDTLVFGNPSCRDLILTAGSLVGSTDFHIVTPVSFPDTLDESVRQTLVVAYSPRSTGPASSTLALQTFYRRFGLDNVTGVDTSLSFAGSGYLIGPMTRPDSVDFGWVSVHASPPEQRVVLTNPDNVDAVVTRIAIVGGDVGDFDLVHVPTPFGLSGKRGRSALDSTTIDVSFSPKVPGRRNASLLVETTLGNRTVPLTGFGIAPPRVELTPRHIHVGDAMVGARFVLIDTVRLINLGGGGNVTVDSIVVTGAQRAEFSVTPTTTSVDVGDTAFFTVTFAPSDTGRATARAVIMLSSDERLGLDLEGNGIPPGVFASPGRLDFPATPIGSISQPRVIDVVNLGATDVDVDAIQILGSDASQFEGDPGPLPRMLRARGQDTIRIPVRFAPEGSVGRRTARVAVHWGSDSVDVIVRGEALDTLPALNPRPLQFGGVHVGGTRVLVDSVELMNPAVGGVNARIDSFTIDGPDAPSFTVSGPAGTTIVPGTVTRFSVSFAPDTTRPYGARVLIHLSTGFAPHVTVIGAGISPGLVSSPAGISFARQKLGTTSSELRLDIRNLSESPRRIDSIMLSGPSAGDFAVSRFDPLTVGGVSSGSETWTAFMTFTPTVSGNREATLRVFFDAGDVVAIPVDGIGEIDGVATEPATVNFGPVYVDSTHWITSAMTVRNLGAAPVRITALTTRGLDSANFGVRISGGDSTIPAGGSTAVDASFRPGEVRAFQSTVIVTFEGGDEVGVPITGVGYLALSVVLQLDTVYTEVGIARPIRATVEPGLGSQDSINGFQVELLVPRESVELKGVLPDDAVLSRLGGDTVRVTRVSESFIVGSELFRLVFEGLSTGRQDNRITLSAAEFYGTDVRALLADGLIVLTGCDIAHPTTFGRPSRIAAIWPNPLRDAGVVRYLAPSGERPWMRIVDVMGNVSRILELPVARGIDESCEIRVDGLANGYYLVELRLGTQRSSFPVLIAR